MTQPASSSFALPSDVQARCINTLSSSDLDRAQLMLNQAANKIRAYTRRTFTKTQSTITLRAVGGIIILPNLPIISVDGLQLVDYLGNKWPVPAFGFDQLDRIDLSFYGTVLNLPESLSFNATWAGTVIVTYTHGYDPVPDDIVELNAEMVARVFNMPGNGAVGVTAQASGIYSVSMGGGLVSGIVQITDDDKLILNRYRRPVRAIETR